MADRLIRRSNDGPVRYITVPEFAATLGVWAAYTPGISGFTTSSSTARWRRNGAGGNVTGMYAAVVASASGELTVTLPVPPAASWQSSGAPVGVAVVYDASTPMSATGIAIIRTTDSVIRFFGNTSGTPWNSTVPFPLAAGDELKFHFDYEPA